MIDEPLFCDYRRLPPISECAAKVRFPVETDTPGEWLTFVLVDRWGHRYEQMVQTIPAGAEVDLEQLPPGLINAYAGEFRAWFVAGSPPNETLRPVVFDGQGWKALTLSFCHCTPAPTSTVIL